MTISKTLQRRLSLLLVLARMESGRRELFDVNPKEPSKSASSNASSEPRRRKNEKKGEKTDPCTLNVPTDHVGGLLLVAEDNHGRR
jgi:hypothetical protein